MPCLILFLQGAAAEEEEFPLAERLLVGGQAVIEGVMMRGGGQVATAVREPSGRIIVESRAETSIAERYPILKKPFLRGNYQIGRASCRERV